jgi:hypothetical protein
MSKYVNTRPATKRGAATLPLSGTELALGGAAVVLVVAIFLALQLIAG